MQTSLLTVGVVDKGVWKTSIGAELVDRISSGQMNASYREIIAVALSAADRHRRVLMSWTK